MRLAKLPPDSIAQAIIVLAYYMNEKQKKIPMTYETASTRRFRYGRTENIRVLSEDGYNWSTEASKPTSKVKDLSTLLERFVNSHLEIAKNASLGNSLDRHLFGLTKVKKEEEELQPKDLFKNDKVFASMFSFDMSTSNMSPGLSFQGLGFGTLTPSGYGVNYCISESRLLFSISSWEFDQTSGTYPMYNCPRFDNKGGLVKNRNESYPKEHFTLMGLSRAEEFKNSLYNSIEITKRVLESRVDKICKL